MRQENCHPDAKGSGRTRKLRRTESSPRRGTRQETRNATHKLCVICESERQTDTADVCSVSVDKTQQRSQHKTTRLPRTVQLCLTRTRYKSCEQRVDLMSWSILGASIVASSQLLRVFVARKNIVVSAPRH